MNIHAKPGSRVRYCNFQSGRHDDYMDCERFLYRNAVYTVEKVAVGRFRSEVWLVEVEGRSFNTVMFEDVPMQWVFVTDTMSCGA